MQLKMKGRAAVLAVILAVLLVLCAFSSDVDNKDRFAIFDNIEIPGGITVNGDAVTLFGNITVNGTVTGDAVSVFGNVEVTGTVDGDAVAVFGNISARESSVINGSAAGIFGGVDKSQNAVIRGETADIKPFSLNRRGLIPRVSVGDMIGLFIVYCFSCLALLIAPDRIKKMSVINTEKTARYFGIGFLAMLVFLPVAAVLSVIFAITIIGIVFIPFIFIAFILAVFVGMVAIEVAIGYRITGELDGQNSLYIHLLVGVIIVYLLKIIPVLGWLAYFALIAIALGIVIDTRLGAPAVKRRVSNV